MMIMFVNDPKAKYRGRIPDGEVRELPVCPIYEHPVEFKHGIICVETYQNIGHCLSPYRQLAVYKGLRRSNELARHFDPKRLV